MAFALVAFLACNNDAKYEHVLHNDSTAVDSAAVKVDSVAVDSVVAPVETTDVQ